MPPALVAGLSNEGASRVQVRVCPVSQDPCAVHVGCSPLSISGDFRPGIPVSARVLLPLRLLFDAPTVAEMALLLVQNHTDKIEPQDLNQILAESETLSEQEARSLLSKRSG